MCSCFGPPSKTETVVVIQIPENKIIILELDRNNPKRRDCPYQNKTRSHTSKLIFVFGSRHMSNWGDRYI